MNFSRFGAKPTRRRRRRQAGSISNIPANRADVRLLRSKRGKQFQPKWSSVMLAPKASPLSIDCMICGAKMELTAAEPRAHRDVYTYRCPSAHLQELAIATTAPRRHILRSGGLGWDARR
jgi:hypothetical protein